MPILLLGWVVQIFLIIHVVRTGRPNWWIWVLFAAPFIGGLAYFVVEILPGSRTERQVGKIGKNIVKSINPDLDLRRRAQELEICGSVDNKRKLAEECLERGMPQDAVALYASTLNGPYKNDPHLIFGLARSHFANTDVAATQRLLSQLQLEHPQFQREEVQLLQARNATYGDDVAAALQQLEAVTAIYSGLEAAFRYGEYLLRQGHNAKASEVLNGLINKAKLFKIQHEEELYWLKQAKRLLASIK
ncbi:hypothetical protein ABHF33_09590 [Chitinibacter sp. FCG-7]|uniref:Cardiolipin synthase N-terminal domain-containing protein n=1 Tax=Chitinibacter mangrovi TaxID=3153927 RepID=A0AAU7F6T4_9NEIS